MIRRLGIVGHEQAKFTEQTEVKAKRLIADYVHNHNVETIVSGECHLGGVDIWAMNLAGATGRGYIGHYPRVHQWGHPWGYKARNLRIVEDSDLVLCVVVKELPAEYKGMRFKTCYHCKDRNPPHVKSGGCWTAWQHPKHEWIIV